MNIKEILKHTTAPSIAAVLIAFAVVPLTMFEGSPTGFQFFINHYSKPHVLAMRNEVQIRDDIKSTEFKVYILESQRLKVLESERLTDTEKEVEMQRINDRLEKQEKRLDKYEDKLHDLNSLWSSGTMLAGG